MIDTRDAVFFLGLCLSATGLALIYPPLGLIWPGLVLTYKTVR